MGRANRNNGKLTRRNFLGAAAGAAGVTILPRSLLGGRGYFPPSERVNIACIGVGSQGTRVMMEFMREPDVQIVAVADPNRESSDYLEWGTNEVLMKERALLGAAGWGSDWKGCTCGREPAKRLVDAYYASKQPAGSSRAGGNRGCAAYSDFRELLDKEKDVDAVVIGTPDHWHAPISIAAMRKGKHVFCQKPMTHAVTEARAMAAVARETRVVTQVAVGNQASEDTRLLCEWIWGGAIGAVREVQNWSSRPFWPQGIEPPANEEPVPAGFDWDLWLGPAPARPYNHVYLPFVWRGWFDFGTGCLGDMGCYSFDTLFRVLKLEAPASVEASSTPVFKETYPLASVIYFDFPARSDMPPVRITWYDGGLRPPRPAELEEGREMGEEKEGLLFIGEKGTIMCGFLGEHPHLIPESKMKAFVPPPKSLPRSAGNVREWLEGCKGGPAGGAHFEFSARVTEAILLGNVAVRAGKKIAWDPAGFKVTNDAAAGQLLDFPYRPEWKGLKV